MLVNTVLHCTIMQGCSSDCDKTLSTKSTIITILRFSDNIGQCGVNIHGSEAGIFSQTNTPYI